MRAKLYGTSAVLVFVLALGASTAQGQDRLQPPTPVATDTSFGEVNYDLSLLSTDSTLVSLSAFRDRVLFINFWASWCAPCIREMPSIDALRRRIEGLDIDVLMVSVDDQLEDIRAFANKHDVETPVFLRAWNREERPFRSALLPRTYIVSKEGRVVYEHTGAANWDSDKIASYLEELARE